MVSRGHILGRLSCIGARVVFADQSSFSERFLTDAIGPEGAIYLVATRYSPVIPPRNNRVTRSCWTASLSPVKFAPQADDFRCSWRRKCHHVGSKSILSAQSSPFFGRSGRVQLRLFSPCFSSCPWPL